MTKPTDLQSTQNPIFQTQPLWTTTNDDYLKEQISVNLKDNLCNLVPFALSSPQPHQICWKDEQISNHH